MNKKLVKWFEDAWYSEMYISAWFMPLSMLYVDAVRLRRFAIGSVSRKKPNCRCR